ATVELPKSPFEMTIYSAVNGVLSKQAESIWVDESDSGDPPEPLCFPASPELNEIVGASPTDGPILQYFVVFARINRQLLETGDLARVKSEAAYSTPPKKWDGRTERPP